MRQILVIVVLALLPVWMFAQEKIEMMPVNWEAIRKAVEENPEHVKGLVARLSAPETDSTLTYPEKILAFYGQSYISKEKEFLLTMDMVKLQREGKYEECMEVVHKVLDINPLNLEALFTARNVLYVMAKDTTRWENITLDDVRPYFIRGLRILDVISKTGDGTKEHPFYVTRVNDEYSFMRYYLDLWEISMQATIDNCDVITLNCKSKYWDRPQIYFEITRVRELETMMLQ